ncbi:MAG: hypothetical protein K0S07_985 [Chlamydiales bacterium]|jgi:hypothetical protein|nr:hypothetical protein [Chlamydiales bacterium]
MCSSRKWEGGFFRESLFCLSSCCLFFSSLSAAETWQLGYKSTSLAWSISGSSGYPNIFSELSWRSLPALNLSYERTLTIDYRQFLVLKGEFSWILNGSCYDTDYAGNHRSLPLVKSSNRSNGMAHGLKLGYALSWPITPSLELVPIAGVLYENYELKMQRGQQILPVSRPIVGLKSRYQALWGGCFLGVHCQYRLQKEMQLALYGEYSRASYRGTGHWNLRSDFWRPFKHRGQANGLSYQASIAKKTERQELSLSFAWKHIQGERGVETTYPRILGVKRAVVGPFNGARLESWTLFCSSSRNF